MSLVNTHKGRGGDRLFFKLGFIKGITNHVDEIELKVMAPADVSCHNYSIDFSRLPEELQALRAKGRGADVSIEDLHRWADPCVEYIASAIKYAHDYQGGFQAGPLSAFALWATFFSMFRGREYDLRLMDRLSNIVEAPTTSTCDAIVRACKELGVKKVAYVLPWQSAAYPQLFDEYMKAAGITPVFHGTFNYEGLSRLVNQPTLQEIYAKAMEKEIGDADALCLLVNGVYYADSIQALELALDRPVLAAGAVTFWSTLKVGGYPGRVEGFGKLLAGHLLQVG